jgi:ribosomal-protein-alanine N-acetyltransferase
MAYSHLLSVGPIAPEDAPDVARIMESVHLMAEVPVGPRWSLQQVANACSGLGLVLRDSTCRLLAFVLFRDAVSAWEITFLATEVEARRCGHMRKVLAHLIVNLPEEKALWLEVHERNSAAQRLYQTVGFREVGIRKNYYNDGGAAILYSYD